MDTFDKVGQFFNSVSEARRNPKRAIIFIIFMIALGLTIYFTLVKGKKTTTTTTTPPTATPEFFRRRALHMRQSGMNGEMQQMQKIDPSGLGIQLGALEKWHLGGYVSPACYRLANEGSMTAGSFSDLVSCLQRDNNQAQINNLNV